MSGQTRTDSHERASVACSAHLRVAVAFSVVMALSAWAPPAASAWPEVRGESDVRPSRGPKTPERSCSPGRSPARDTENPPNRGGDFGYRHRSAAPVQPAAASGGNSGGGCPDDEPSGAASGGGQPAGGRRADAGPSDSPGTRDPSRAGERSAPGSPGSGRPTAGTPAGSGAGPGTTSERPQGSSPPPDNDASADDRSDGSGASGARSPDTGNEQGRAASPKPRSGGGTGSGNRRPGGAPGAGRGGNHSPPRADIGRAPSGGAGDGLPGFRSAPAKRVRFDGAGSLRVPGSVLLSSPGIPSSVLSSTAAAALAAPGHARAAPIPRTGGEISASTVLALLLLLVGGALRRTARVGARTPA
jgi:hypothetical protein